MSRPVSAPPSNSLFNLRWSGGVLPPGKCVYVQSGDTSDFDGYYIAAAGQVVQRETKDFAYVIAVPERRAWRDKTESDTMRHDPSYGDEVLSTSGQVLRHLCPDAMIVRGALNARNIIPWSWMFNEPEKYGPLLAGMPPVSSTFSTVQQLAALVTDPSVSSVVLDMNGSMGYLCQLVEALGPDGREALGAKMRAAGIPFIVMAGVVAEEQTLTLPMPGRDPRATKNAIYYPDAVRVLLALAQDYGVPLLFVTNNLCNKCLKFQDAAETAQKMGLQGLLRRISDVWFGQPHLKGKCVPFDWMAFAAMLLHGRKAEAMQVAQLELWVGKADPSVLVLRDPDAPHSDTVEANLQDTECWGVVGSVTSMDTQVLLDLAVYASDKSAKLAP